jgi:hypothetical protein
MRTARSGTDFHDWATTAMATAWNVSFRKLNGWSKTPTPIRRPFTIPKWVSKMYRQKMPATTDAIAQGMSSARKKIETPRNPRLSVSAVISARGSVIAVVTAAKNSVLGIASRIVLSAGSRSR